MLKPESSQPHYRPILVGPDFSIQGVVTKVIEKGLRFWTAKEMNMSRKNVHVTYRKSGKCAVISAGDDTKAEATRRGVLEKALGSGSVIIHKEHGGFQEERTYPGSKDPKKWPG